MATETDLDTWTPLVGVPAGDELIAAQDGAGQAISMTPERMADTARRAGKFYGTHVQNGAEPMVIQPLGTPYPLVFPDLIIDNTGGWSVANQNWVAPYQGYFLISAGVHFTDLDITGGTQTFNFRLEMRKNGLVVESDARNLDSRDIEIVNNEATLSMSSMARVEAGDAISFTLTNTATESLIAQSDGSYVGVASLGTP